MTYEKPVEILKNQLSKIWEHISLLDDEMHEEEDMVKREKLRNRVHDLEKIYEEYEKSIELLGFW